MSGTKRTPLHRRSRAMAISDAALDIFDRMVALRCSGRPRNEAQALLCKCSHCAEWWTLHPRLRRALNERLWNFPVISRLPPDRRKRWLCQILFR